MALTPPIDKPIVNTAQRGRLDSGMSLVEISAALVIIVILVAILTPIVSNYIVEARLAKAQAETQAIGDAILRFVRDVGRFPMFTSGAGLLQDSAANVLRLESSGNAPTEAVASAWTTTVMDADCAVSCNSATLSSQLLLNSPSYVQTSSLSKPFKWKGPYMDAQSDPWGNRYLVNIINCKNSSADACFVLSAGPNGAVETVFNISKTTAISAAGDDVIYRIK